MSEENVALSKRGLEAWNRRNVEATIALADPEIVWHPAVEEMVEGRTYRGHAGMRQYFRDLAEQAASEQAASHAELSELRDLGDQVLGLGRLSFRSIGGVEVSQDVELIHDFAFLHRWRIEAWTWLSHPEALEAAGLSE